MQIQSQRETFAYRDTARWRIAMAWDEYAPQIQHWKDQEGRSGTYHIDHTELPAHPMTGHPRSWLDYEYRPKRPGEVFVSMIYTHPEYRKDGVAEALMRRLHEDHPNHRIDPGFMTSDGQSFKDRMLQKIPEAQKAMVQDDSMYMNASHRTAMPAPAPSNLNFRFHSDHSTVPSELADELGVPSVTAHLGDDPTPVGSLEWYGEGDEEAWPGEILNIQVHPDHRHKSIATSMFDWVRDNIEPELHHSHDLTEDGAGWRDYEESRHAHRTAMPAPDFHLPVKDDEGVPLESVLREHLFGRFHATRLAAVNQQFVDGLRKEFRDWWISEDGIKAFRQHPAISYYLEHSQRVSPVARIIPPDVDLEKYREQQDSYRRVRNEMKRRGPIGWWPNVENFLKDRYPAAHKGFNSGMEQATFNIDYKNPYETGPEAVEQHGYDPKEIAAGMILLHNQSHPFRGELAEPDQQRLVNIFQKRQDMQRNYEKQLVTAARRIFSRAYEDDDYEDEDYWDDDECEDSDGDGLGDCYESAARHLLTSGAFREPDSPLRLVHGEVAGQGPLQGKTFGHAWIEDGDDVIDNSNGNNIRMPKNLYYQVGKINQLNNFHVYTPEEARDKLLSTQIYGPWDLIGKHPNFTGGDSRDYQTG